MQLPRFAVHITSKMPLSILDLPGIRLKIFERLVLSEPVVFINDGDPSTPLYLAALIFFGAII